MKELTIKDILNDNYDTENFGYVALFEINRAKDFKFMIDRKLKKSIHFRRTLFDDVIKENRYFFFYNYDDILKFAKELSRYDDILSIHVFFLENITLNHENKDALSLEDINIFFIKNQKENFPAIEYNINLYKEKLANFLFAEDIDNILKIPFDEIKEKNTYIEEIKNILDRINNVYYFDIIRWSNIKVDIKDYLSNEINVLNEILNKYKKMPSFLNIKHKGV
jgi:hypothetical protein